MKNKTITSLIVSTCLMIPTLSKAEGKLIEDSNLEVAIKNKLMVTELSKENIRDLEYLLIYRDNNIKSLKGLENATSLGQFLVQYNQITDLKPLANFYY